MIWKMLAGLVLAVAMANPASAAERVARVAVFSSGAVHLPRPRSVIG